MNPFDQRTVIVNQPINMLTVPYWRFTGFTFVSDYRFHAMFLRIKILHISCPVACNLLSGRIIMILTPEQPGASSCLQMDYCKRFTPSFLMCFFLSFVLTAHKITTGGLHCLSCQHGQLRQLAVPVVHQFQFCKTARTTYHLLVIFSGLLERSFITLRRHLRTIIIPDSTQN